MKAAILILLLSSSALGQQVMTNAKLTSCNVSICTKLVSDEIHRSNISPNIMAFGDVIVELFKADDTQKQVRSFKAGDGYMDLEEQVLVLRDLKDSKYKELIYNLKTSSINYY
jgi:hypothetical protein